MQAKHEAWSGREEKRRMDRHAPLNKDEHALMPQHRQLVLACPTEWRVRQPDEVEDQGVNDLVWQGVLLVEQDTDEERIGT
jgi:hypothetical protein